MRLVTIEKRIGSFSELSPELQTKVIEKFRYDWDDFDPDFIIEGFCNAMEEIGVDISPKNVYFSGFYSQGDGSCFSGKVVNFVNYISDVVNNYKQLFQSEKEFNAFKRWCDHVYNDCDYDIEIAASDRYFTIRVNTDITTELYRLDHVKRRSEEQEDRFIRILDYIIEEKAIEDNAKLYKALENEYEYRMSDGYIKDMIEANEYEFNLDTGEVF